ncbi:MAG: DUF47 family protein [Desulfuromonadia bacterium]
MFGLIPKEEKFFAMFREMGEIITEGATALKTMLDDYIDPVASQRSIKDIEHKGDNKTHEIIKTLNKTFITPLDREDIYSLASKLDDILDLIDASSQRFVMYNVEKPTPASQELAFIILKCSQTIQRALRHLGGKFDDINDCCVEINALENEADRVCREAISKLFDEEKDPITLIKWKEIYETLEKATDKCEDAANILESVVVKHA